MDTIRIQGRYGEWTLFDNIGEDRWLAHFPEGAVRVIEDKGKIWAVDPSGGPYFHLGFSLTPSLVVKAISHDDSDGGFVFAVSKC